MKKVGLLAIVIACVLCVSGCKISNMLPEIQSQIQSQVENWEENFTTEAPTETTASGTTSSDDEAKIMPEDPVAAFMALVEKYNGFEVTQSWGDGQTIIVGGKGNVYWSKTIKNVGTITLLVGKYENGAWSDTAYNIADEVITGPITPEMTITLASAEAYASQIYAEAIAGDPTDSEVIGLACRKYPVLFGLAELEIFKEYGVTACYTIKDNAEESFKITAVKTGSDVTEIEVPEGGKKVGEIDNPDYWNELYGVNICPFTIIADGVETEYFFRNGGSLEEWLRTEMNTDGWYWFEEKVISKDGKWAIEDPESFSSFCSYEAKPYDGPTLDEGEQEEIKKGDLYALHSWTPLCLNNAWNGIAFLDKTEGDLESAISGLPYNFKVDEEVKISRAAHDDDLEGELAEKCVLYVFPHRDFSEYKEMLGEITKAEALCEVGYERLSEDTDLSELEQARWTFLMPEDAIGDVDLLFVFDDVVAYAMEVEVEE